MSSYMTVYSERDCKYLFLKLASRIQVLIYQSSCTITCLILIYQIGL